MGRYVKIVFLLILFAGRVVQGHSQQESIPDTGDSSLLAPEMIFVAGGPFQMGSLLDVPDERPIHEVILDDFYIGKYEITQKLWDDIMGPDDHDNYIMGCPFCPVERVSWYNVREFLKKLNEKTGMNFRLPTEAEWEYAARGGKYSKRYIYSGSDTADAVAWRDGNAEGRSQPVGEKRPNELGICDMSGNVWEWCSDYYSQDYYMVSPRINPQGPSTGTFRVIRGGSWFHDRTGLRVSDRDKANPEFRYGYLGFRVCRSK